MKDKKRSLFSKLLGILRGTKVKSNMPVVKGNLGKGADYAARRKKMYQDFGYSTDDSNKPAMNRFKRNF